MFRIGCVYRFTMSANGSSDDIGSSLWEVIDVNLPLVHLFQGVSKEVRIVNTGSIYFISAEIVDENVGSDYWNLPDLNFTHMPPVADK